jgi:hypothetical protein
MTMKAEHYQDTGSVNGWDAEALKAANSWNNASEAQTPMALRELFRKYIRRTATGYEYGWVLK